MRRLSLAGRGASTAAKPGEGDDVMGKLSKSDSLDGQEEEQRQQQSSLDTLPEQKQQGPPQTYSHPPTQRPDGTMLQKALAIAAFAAALAAVGPFRLIWVVILAFGLNFVFHYLRDAILDTGGSRTTTGGTGGGGLEQAREWEGDRRLSAREAILSSLNPFPPVRSRATSSSSIRASGGLEYPIGGGDPARFGFAAGFNKVGRTALDVGDELERPLDWACSLIVRDFVSWWYDPLANDDGHFPRQCRSILNGFFNHLTRHMREKSARDLLLSTIVSATNTLLVYLCEFRLFKISAQSDQLLDEYLEKNPMSALARLADREHQLGSLRNTSAGILETHMNASHHPLVLTFTREMLANQVLWKTVEAISEPDWLNRKIVQLLSNEDGGGRNGTAKDSKQGPKSDGQTTSEQNAVDSTTLEFEQAAPAESKLSDPIASQNGLESLPVIAPELVESVLLQYEADKSKAEELGSELQDLPQITSTLKPHEEQLQQTLAERGDEFFDFNSMIEDPHDKALLHLYSQITTFKEVTAMMDPGPAVTREDALVIFRTHFRQAATEWVNIDQSFKEGILKVIMIHPSKEVFVPLEILALQRLAGNYWALFIDYRAKQREAVTAAQKTINGQRPYSLESNRSTNGTDSDAFSSSSASITPMTLSPQDVQVSVTDISPDVDPMKPILSKKDLEFMVAVEGLDGPTAPGFITMRKWVDLEQLDSALQKTLPRGAATHIGTSDFRRHAPLPSWKHQTSGNLCLALQGYLKSLILDARVGQSEPLAKFLDRENVAMRRKWKEVPVIGTPLWAVGAVHEGIEGVGKNTWKALGGAFAGPKPKGNVNVPGTSFTPPSRPLGSSSSTTLPILAPKGSSAATPDDESMRFPDMTEDSAAAAAAAVAPKVGTMENSASNLGRAPSSSIPAKSTSEFSRVAITNGARPDRNSVESLPLRPASSTSQHVTPTSSRTASRGPPPPPGEKDSPLPSPTRASSSQFNDRSSMEVPNTRSSSSVSGVPAATMSTFSRSEVDLVIDSGIAVVEEMYDLAGRQFNVRRTVLNLLRQIVRRSYSETVRLQLEDILEKQASEIKIAETIKSMTDSFWPNGEWAGSADPKTKNRTEEDKAKTREEARALLVASVPDVLKITLGGAATATAVNSLFDLLQEKKLSRAIVTGLVLDFVRLFL